MALANLGKKADACAAFGEFSQKFPTAAAPLKRQATEEKTRSACKASRGACTGAARAVCGTGRG